MFIKKNGETLEFQLSDLDSTFYNVFNFEFFINI